MRTAEEFLADMRRLGRSDDQVLTIAAVAHAGRLRERVEELLAMPAEEAAALAPEPEAEPETFCEKCGSPMVDDVCPEADAHDTDEVEDVPTCVNCGAPLVDNACSICQEPERELQANGKQLPTEEMMEEFFENNPPPQAKKKKRRML